MKLHHTSFLIGLLIPLALLGVQSLASVKAIEPPRPEFSPPYPVERLEELPVTPQPDTTEGYPLTEVAPGERLIVLQRQRYGQNYYVWRWPIAVGDTWIREFEFDFNPATMLTYLDEGTYVFTTNSGPPTGTTSPWSTHPNRPPFIGFRVKL